MPQSLQLLILAHAFATVLMTGVIWFVQIVHYPLFARVPDDGFAIYERDHQRRTTWVVAPAMLIELTTALTLAITLPADARPLAWAGLALLGVIWGSTAFVQVPLHRRLEAGRDAEAIRRLVATNWVRTIAWSGRSAIALALA